MEDFSTAFVFDAPHALLYEGFVEPNALRRLLPSQEPHEGGGARHRPAGDTPGVEVLERVDGYRLTWRTTGPPEIHGRLQLEPQGEKRTRLWLYLHYDAHGVRSALGFDRRHFEGRVREILGTLNAPTPDTDGHMRRRQAPHGAAE